MIHVTSATDPLSKYFHKNQTSLDFLFFIFIIIVYTFISDFCISPEFSNEKLIRARFIHQF